MGGNVRGGTESIYVTDAFQKMSKPGSQRRNWRSPKADHSPQVAIATGMSHGEGQKQNQKRCAFQTILLVDQAPVKR
jgi:hypothetical protein